MNANPILQKLDGLTARFEEVSTLITDPEVIADRNRFVRLTKEYKGLEELLAAKRDYEQLLANLDEARSIVMNDDDPDLKEMAREEIAAGEERLPALEEQIKLMLVPADPEDAKNAIVEIRGGTGGDEAALFAGDLYRMYAKYCEIRVGEWPCQALARAPRADSRRSSSPLRATTCTARLNTSRACTACSVCRRPRRRDASTRRRLPWPSCPRRTSST